MVELKSGVLVTEATYASALHALHDADAHKDNPETVYAAFLKIHELVSDENVFEFITNGFSLEALRVDLEASPMIQSSESSLVS
jgi:hypothetical protein